MSHGAAIQQVQQVSSSHDQIMLEIHHHLQDLDNRGRRHNLGLRRIPESMEGPQLQKTIWAICNTLLGRSLDAPIEMKRCHRTLRPKSCDTGPPRDVVSCLVSFSQKKDILHQALNQGQIQHDGAPIQIYQDLYTNTDRENSAPFLMS